MTNFLQCYLGATMVIFAFLGLIWTSKNWPNVFMKFVFIVMSISAGIFLASALGFIVKA